MEVNNVNSNASAAQLQTNTEQQARRQAETEPQSPNVVQSDTVTISSAVSESQETNSTSIQNAQQAQDTASRIVNLFQQQPDLAATAQGGKMTAEKADAYMRANVG